jgi:hypothetical protein
MSKPSKFSRPNREPAPEEIERIIGKAEPRDEPAQANAPPEAETRFTMVLPASLSDRVDKARKAAGGLARLAWIRIAIVEKLSRDGL